MNRPAESCSAERLYTTPITSRLSDRLEHQVTDEAAAASRNTHRYQALCGQLFDAASLAAPTGRPCPACAAILAIASRAVAPAGAHQPCHRRHGLLRRLLHPGGWRRHTLDAEDHTLTESTLWVHAELRRLSDPTTSQ